MISLPYRLVGWLAPTTLMALSVGCSEPSAPATVAADPVEFRTSVSDAPSQSVEPLAPPTFEAEVIAGFAESTVSEEIPEGQSPPDDKTMSGRSTASVRQAVEKVWPTIALVGKDSKPIPYVVTLHTGEGPVEIALFTKTAPTHARHTVALAVSGYFDGLCFDRIVRQEARTETGLSRLELLRGGCPRGTGDEGIGHIGYWLGPEIDPALKHEAGTVGFWHDADTQASGCRFYVTLGPAPIMDGHFTIVGKVTSGLDTLRKIADKPAMDAKTDPERPKAPTSIRKATVSPEPKGG